MAYKAPTSANTHTIGETDVNKCIRFTDAGANSVVFPDTLVQGMGGWVQRAAGAGAVTWSATGNMVVTPSSSSAGHTGSNDAPAFLWWECDDINSVVIGGDTV
jgi:hypothetical protein